MLTNSLFLSLNLTLEMWKLNFVKNNQTTLIHLLYFHPHYWCDSAGWLVLHFGPDWNISTIIGCIVMTFCTNSHNPQMTKATDFGDTNISSGTTMRHTLVFFSDKSWQLVGWIAMKCGSHIHVPLVTLTAITLAIL